MPVWAKQTVREIAFCQDSLQNDFLAELVLIGDPFWGWCLFLFLSKRELAFLEKAGRASQARTIGMRFVEGLEWGIPIIRLGCGCFCW